jgi:hypothetical protein
MNESDIGGALTDTNTHSLTYLGLEEKRTVECVPIKNQFGGNLIYTQWTHNNSYGCVHVSGVAANVIGKG